MAASVLADTGFLVAILTRHDSNHEWATGVSRRHPPPWYTCEAALSEAFHLLGLQNAFFLEQLLRRRGVVCPFHLNDNIEQVVALMRKYESVPMSFADACLVRMSETISQPVLLTTDADFRIYRRHSRQVVPCVMPG